MIIKTVSCFSVLYKATLFLLVSTLILLRNMFIRNMISLRMSLIKIVSCVYRVICYKWILIYHFQTIMYLFHERQYFLVDFNIFFGLFWVEHFVEHFPCVSLLPSFAIIVFSYSFNNSPLPLYFILYVFHNRMFSIYVMLNLPFKTRNLAFSSDFQSRLVVVD